MVSSLGYQQKSRIKKRGEGIKYRNLPIFILITTIESDVTDSTGKTIISNKKSSSQISIIEITCLCLENEKEKYSTLLRALVDKLLNYCIFECDNTNIIWNNKLNKN